MRIRIPLLVTFLTAIVLIVVYFTPHGLRDFTEGQISEWYRVIVGIALVLGIVSLMQTHLRKIFRRQRDWVYSIVAIIAFLVMSAVGIGWGIEQGTILNWIFSNIYAPLDATMFSLLGFFVASAAYRTFRARTIEAALLLTAALVVMFGRVPLGEALLPKAPNVAEWIMSNPAMGAKRGILIGVSLGGIAMSLRILLGIERSHLGGETKG